MNSEGKGLNCVVFLRFQPVVLSLSDDVKCSLMSELGSKDIQFVRITAHKPQYEVGSSSQLKLSFGKNKTGEYYYSYTFQKHHSSIGLSIMLSPPGMDGLNPIKVVELYN